MWWLKGLWHVVLGHFADGSLKLILALDSHFVGSLLSVENGLGLRVEAIQITLELGLHVLSLLLVFREDLILCDDGWGFSNRRFFLLFFHHLDLFNFRTSFLNSFFCGLVNGIERVHSWIFGSSNSLFFPEISNLFR